MALHLATYPWRLVLAATFLLAQPISSVAQSSGVPPDGSGQEAPATSLAELSARLTPREQVEVVRRDGTTVGGQLVAVSGQGITVNRGGESIEVPARLVQEVARRGDPLSNGIAWGAIAGGLAGLVPGVVLVGSGADTPGTTVAAAAVIGAGAGAVIGLLWDAGVSKRSVVFRATPRTVTVMPVLGSERRGVLLAIRF